MEPLKSIPSHIAAGWYNFGRTWQPLAPILIYIHCTCISFVLYSKGLSGDSCLFDLNGKVDWNLSVVCAKNTENCCQTITNFPSRSFRDINIVLYKKNCVEFPTFVKWYYVGMTNGVWSDGIIFFKSLRVKWHMLFVFHTIITNFCNDAEKDAKKAVILCRFFFNFQKPRDHFSSDFIS